MPNPIEQLADAFKTEAMKSAWPVVKDIFKNVGIKTKDYDVLFDKESHVTAMSKAGNEKLVKLSQDIQDAIVAEFTSPAHAEEVIAQTQNVKIKSSLRVELERERTAMEKAGTKDMSLDKRLVMAGLQSFFEQLANIDVTSVLKAKQILEANARIEAGKKQRAPAQLSPKQTSAGRIALNDFANGAVKNSKLTTDKILKQLAKQAVTALTKQGIEVSQLSALYSVLEPYGDRQTHAAKLKELIAEAYEEAK